MTSIDFRMLLHALIGIVAIVTIQACGCGRTASFKDAGSVSRVGSETDDLDAATLLDSESNSEDSAMNGDKTTVKTDAGDLSVVKEDAKVDSKRIPTDRIVNPNDLSIEVLDEYIDEPTNWNELPTLEDESCGYSMTIDWSNDEATQREVRLFDEKGKLLIQQSNDLMTEVIYDKEGRPISIWRKDNRFTISHPEQTAIIIAVGYNRDESAISKTVFCPSDMVDDPEESTCIYLALDRNRKLETLVNDRECDDITDYKVEMTYLQNGKPLHYQKQGWRGRPYSEISWNYLDNGNLAKATWNETKREAGFVSERGESIFYFDFDNSDKLVSIRVDYKNDGETDASTEYQYDEWGNVTRIATDIDQDGIEDLLRINTYNQKRLLATREVRNLMPPEYGVGLGDSEFDSILAATAKKTVYTYDNASNLVESVTESYPAEGKFRSVHETYRYDDLNRLLDKQVETRDYLEDSPETRELDSVNVTTCTFDYPCDTLFDESSQLRRCEIGTPVHGFLFPYDTVQEMPFYSNRIRELRVENNLDPEDVLGIPWY